MYRSAMGDDQQHQDANLSANFVFVLMSYQHAKFVSGSYWYFFFLLVGCCLFFFNWHIAFTVLTISDCVFECLLIFVSFDLEMHQLLLLLLTVMRNLNSQRIYISFFRYVFQTFFIGYILIVPCNFSCFCSIIFAILINISHQRLNIRVFWFTCVLIYLELKSICTDFTPWGLTLFVCHGKTFG